MLVTTAKIADVSNNSRLQMPLLQCKIR
jgi:hypothetical protein